MLSGLLGLVHRSVRHFIYIVICTDVFSVYYSHAYGNRRKSVGGIVIDLRSVNDIGFVASVFALAAFLFTYLWLIRKIRANAETGRENSL